MTKHNYCPEEEKEACDMPHIHATHPCAPDSLSWSEDADNPIFMIANKNHNYLEAEKVTDNLGSHLRLTTQSLPSTPCRRIWQRMSFESVSSQSVSETSSMMFAEKGSFIYEKMYALVTNLNHRAQRVKEVLVRCPTPSSANSEQSRRQSLIHLANRRRFESLITFTSSFHSISQHTSLDSLDDDDDTSAAKNHSAKRKCLKFWKSLWKWYIQNSIDPQSKLYILWLALVSICYVYNAWGIILRASFPYQTPDNVAVWLACDYVADAVYLLDIIWCKPRIKALKDGFWITKPKETARLYIQNRTFVFDLLSLLPLDLFYLCVGINPLLRFPRLLKIHTYREFFERFDRVAKMPHIIRVIHTLGYMLFLIHINACAYYAYSDFEGIGRPDNVWVYNGEGNAYIRCFLFATKIATSIGKNPTPVKIGEYIFMIISWLSGVFIFAVLIGQMRDILSVASQNETQYRKTVDRTLSYMNRLNLSSKLHSHARMWFMYNWQQQKSLNEHKVLRSLPRKMQMDIAVYVHYNVLCKVRLFQDFDRNLLRELVLKLKHYLYLPGDYICKKGEVGREMYIINYGIVEIMYSDKEDVVATTLTEGNVFGEASLLLLGVGNRCTATARSKGFSSIFVLNKADLHAAVKDYPLAQEILRQRGKSLMKSSHFGCQAGKSYNLHCTDSEMKKSNIDCLTMNVTFSRERSFSYPFAFNLRCPRVVVSPPC